MLAAKLLIAEKYLKEQLYQRSSHTVVKILGPTTDVPTWGSGKGNENTQGIRL